MFSWMLKIALNNRPLQYLEDDIQMPTLTPNSMLFVGCNAIPELEAHHEEEADLRKRAKFLSRCKGRSVAQMVNGIPPGAT